LDAAGSTFGAKEGYQVQIRLSKRARTPQEAKAKHAAIKRLYRNEAKQRAKERGEPKTKPSLKVLRATELERLFTARYGGRLPDDDAGHDDAAVMAHHLHPDAIRGWLRRWAPWMGEREVMALISEAEMLPQTWKADPLAKRLGLTIAERTELEITTIGAIDFTKAPPDFNFEYAMSVAAGIRSAPIPPTEAERVAESARHVAAGEARELEHQRLNSEAAARATERNIEQRKLAAAG
jgi:hypothetical protein